MYRLILTDGTEISAASDELGNYIGPETLDEGLFTDENLVSVTIIEDTGTRGVYKDQTLRAFYHTENGTFFRISEKTEAEKTAETIQMLTDCLLEMSETVYA